MAAPSGSGKTRLLRTLIQARQLRARWTTAFVIAHGLVDALRREGLAEYQEALAADPRLLVVEHLEGLRGRELTQTEVGRLLRARAPLGHPLLCTLTSIPGSEDVDRWLSGWTEALHLGRSRPNPGAHRTLP